MGGIGAHGMGYLARSRRTHVAAFSARRDHQRSPILGEIAARTRSPHTTRVHLSGHRAEYIQRLERA